MNLPGPDDLIPDLVCESMTTRHRVNPLNHELDDKQWLNVSAMLTRVIGATLIWNGPVRIVTVHMQMDRWQDTAFGLLREHFSDWAMHSKWR